MADFIEHQALSEDTSVPVVHVEDRIRRWLNDPVGEESESGVDLLESAEHELRRLRAAGVGLLAALRHEQKKARERERT